MAETGNTPAPAPSSTPAASGGNTQPPPASASPPDTGNVEKRPPEDSTQPSAPRTLQTRAKNTDDGGVSPIPMGEGVVMPSFSRLRYVRMEDVDALCYKGVLSQQKRLDDSTMDPWTLSAFMQKHADVSGNWDRLHDLFVHCVNGCVSPSAWDTVVNITAMDQRKAPITAIPASRLAVPVPKPPISILSF
uniref:Uncharacterized protein n=1 Tax=Phytophthora ramorum TaxID=164328 RepID=H3GF72_PHYRM